MQLEENKIKEILVRGNYVTVEDITRAEKQCKRDHTSIVDYLLNQEFISQDLLGQAIAESFGISYADLNSNPPSRDQVLKISEKIAKKYRVILYSEENKSIIVATDNPANKGLKKVLSSVFPKKTIQIAYALEQDLESNFRYYRKSLETRFSNIVKQTQHIAPELVEQILSDAIALHASDVHFEPQVEDILIRFRVDGVLQEAGRLPRKYYESIVNRIKVQSRLRIDKHFGTQDGSMQYVMDKFTVDLRTSIVPTVEGEKIVLRILAAYVGGLRLSELGLSSQHQSLLSVVAQKPFGMILVTGPTGCGKTTTLYAILKILNRPDVNITTIEDPVEYKMLGVNQIQVNAQSDLTFATGLRAIVRQDPDVVLVGEIRDKETAEISVNAALTGHLLLSTFHATDAATAIPRLLDIGIEPFLLSSTLEAVIAQRLVRKICEHCRFSSKISIKDLNLPTKVTQQFFVNRAVTLYQGKGCESCGYSGFIGRTAIFEFIPITPKLRDIILNRPSAQEIWNLASTQGALSLFADGIEKVKNGITTLEELKRIVGVPSSSVK